MAENQDFVSLAALAEPIRRRLYDHVVSRRAAVSKDDAARAIGIGRTLAAYHLDRLIDAGLLVGSYARVTGRTGPGAGRTAKLYEPSGREFEANAPQRDYRHAAEMLAAAIERDGSGTALSVAHEAAYDAGVSDGRAVPNTESLEAILDARGYQPYTDEQGTMRLANCPFRRLAEAHRDLVCGMNLAWVRGVLDATTRGQLHVALDPRQGCCCVAVSKGATPGSGT